MLDGWYCRSMAANAEEEEEEEEEESQEEVINYKTQYRSLKRKLKYLIYENECFQEALKASQKRLLKACRDRSFLLDRLLLYEKVDVTSSESDETESSDDGESNRPDSSKRKRTDSGMNSHGSIPQPSSTIVKTPLSAKKKRSPNKTSKQNSVPLVSDIATDLEESRVMMASKQLQSLGSASVCLLPDGHLTPEEVERHLESRQSYMELLPEKAPPTVPTEMFSNDPSLDSESNEVGELETSPSNMGEDCLSIDMIPE